VPEYVAISVALQKWVGFCLKLTGFKYAFKNISAANYYCFTQSALNSCSFVMYS
jgi:hypothetical protein